MICMICMISWSVWFTWSIWPVWSVWSAWSINRSWSVWDIGLFRSWSVQTVFFWFYSLIWQDSDGRSRDRAGRFGGWSNAQIEGDSAGEPTDRKKVTRYHVIGIFFFQPRGIFSPAADCEKAGFFSLTHDVYKNTWKCVELKLNFSPSSGANGVCFLLLRCRGGRMKDTCGSGGPEEARWG